MPFAKLDGSVPKGAYHVVSCLFAPPLPRHLYAFHTRPTLNWFNLWPCSSSRLIFAFCLTSYICYSVPHYCRRIFLLLLASSSFPNWVWVDAAAVTITKLVIVSVARPSRVVIAFSQLPLGFGQQINLPERSVLVPSRYLFPSRPLEWNILS